MQCYITSYLFCIVYMQYAVVRPYVIEFTCKYVQVSNNRVRKGIVLKKVESREALKAYACRCVLMHDAKACGQRLFVV